MRKQIHAANNSLKSPIQQTNANTAEEGEIGDDDSEESNEEEDYDGFDKSIILPSIHVRHDFKNGLAQTRKHIYLFVHMLSGSTVATKQDPNAAFSCELDESRNFVDIKFKSSNLALRTFWDASAMLIGNKFVGNKAAITEIQMGMDNTTNNNNNVPEWIFRWKIPGDLLARSITSRIARNIVNYQPLQDAGLERDGAFILMVDILLDYDDVEAFGTKQTDMHGLVGTSQSNSMNCNSNPKRSPATSETPIGDTGTVSTSSASDISMEQSEEGEDNGSSSHDHRIGVPLIENDASEKSKNSETSESDATTGRRPFRDGYGRIGMSSLLSKTSKKVSGVAKEYSSSLATASAKARETFNSSIAQKRVDHFERNGPGSKKPPVVDARTVSNNGREDIVSVQTLTTTQEDMSSALTTMASHTNQSNTPVKRKVGTMHEGTSNGGSILYLKSDRNDDCFDENNDSTPKKAKKI